MREVTRLFSGTGGGGQVVREPSRENRSGGVQLTREEGSLGEVSRGAWLCPQSGRKHSFARQGSGLTRDPKEARCSCGREAVPGITPWHWAAPQPPSPGRGRARAGGWPMGVRVLPVFPSAQEQTREQDEVI